MAIRSVHEHAFGPAAEANLVQALGARGQATLSLVAVQDDLVIELYVGALQGRPGIVTYQPEFHAV